MNLGMNGYTIPWYHKGEEIQLSLTSSSAPYPTEGAWEAMQILSTLRVKGITTQAALNSALAGGTDMEESSTAGQATVSVMVQDNADGTSTSSVMFTGTAEQVLAAQQTYYAAKTPAAGTAGASEGVAQRVIGAALPDDPTDPLPKFRSTSH